MAIWTPEWGRAFATATPAHYAYATSRGMWRPFRHLRLLNRALMGVYSGKIKRLGISKPPQHGKSEFASHRFPAWFLGKFPERRVLLASYQADYAAEWGGRVRDTVDEWNPSLFGTRVSDKSKARDLWYLDGHRGGMATAGVGGPLTGRSADLAIIDDPIKNAEEANSETIRQAIWDWYGTTLLTRVSEIGAVVLIMTRWHQDDLSGRLRGLGEDWTWITLPAISLQEREVPAEARDEFWPDALGREPGQPLCPELHSLEKLEKHRLAMGDPWFWAMYQQWPTSGAGGMFTRDWWQYWTHSTLPCPLVWNPHNNCWHYKDAQHKFDDVIISWDLTFGTLHRDYVVGQVWARLGPNYWLLDQERARMGFPEAVAAIRRLKARWPMSTATLVEAKAAGPEAIRTLKKEIPGIIPVIPEAYGSKEKRAGAITYLVQAGNVFIPRPSEKPWVLAFLDELTAFPRGRHDDQVDTLSQALGHWQTKGGKPAFGTVNNRTDFSRMTG